MIFDSSFLEKRVSVSTYFDVFSNLMIAKVLIAKAGETRGSRTALLSYPKLTGIVFLVVFTVLIDTLMPTCRGLQTSSTASCLHLIQGQIGINNGHGMKYH